MAVRDLVVYGAPILRKSMLHTSNSDPHVQDVIRDLWDTLHHIGAAGLAANQIGEPYNICVIFRWHLTLINPDIISVKDKFPSVEGCYSLPGYKAIVPRYKSIKVVATYPATPLNPTLKLVDDVQVSVPIQHEVDHLNGILIRDYVERAYNKDHGVLIDTYDPTFVTATSFNKQREKT